MQSRNVQKSMATADSSLHMEKYQPDPNRLMARGPCGPQAVYSLPPRAQKQSGLIQKVQWYNVLHTLQKKARGLSRAHVLWSENGDAALTAALSLSVYSCISATFHRGRKPTSKHLTNTFFFFLLMLCDFCLTSQERCTANKQLLSGNHCCSLRHSDIMTSPLRSSCQDLSPDSIPTSNKEV